MIAIGFVQEIVTIYERLRTGWEKAFEEMERNYRAVVGDMLEPDVREALKKDGRPIVEINLVQPKIIALAGMLEANKMFMRAIPVNEGDEMRADIHTRLVSDWAMRNCGATKEFIRAGLDAAIAKIGWVNNYWTTDGDVAGRWVTESCSPFNFLIELEARKQDQTDWHYYIYTDFYTADEIIGIHAEHLDDETIDLILSRDAQIRERYSDTTGKKPESWISRFTQGFRDFAGLDRGDRSTISETYSDGINLVSDYCNAPTGRYRVIEFHEKRSEIRRVFYNPQVEDSKQRVVDAPEKNESESHGDYAVRLHTELAQKNAQQPGWILQTFNDSRLWINVACPTLLPERLLVEAPYDVQGHGFQHKPVFCYPLHTDLTKTASIVDILISPTNSFNQRRMTLLEWLMKDVNPDYTAPINSIPANEEINWKSKARGKIKKFRVINGMKPEPERPMPEAASVLAAFAEEDRTLNETVSLITPNTLGLSENSSESGVLFYQRVQRTMQSLSYYFSNLQALMKECFKYCDASLQVYMTMPRKIRLLNKDNKPEFVAVNWQTIQGVHNDVTEGEFDFEPDLTQLGETAKQVQFAEALEILKIMSQGAPELVKWDEIFNLWDSPVSIPWGNFVKQMMAAKLGMQLEQYQTAKTSSNIQMSEALLGGGGGSQPHEGGLINPGGGPKNPTQVPGGGQ